jgi:hypothetical protein
MLQTLTDYATERLLASGEAEAVGARHARYFASRVAPAERGLMSHDQAKWIDWLRLEWANITTAIDHALAIDDAETAIQLVAPLGWYFFMIDETVAGTEWMHAALACTENPIRVCTRWPSPRGRSSLPPVPIRPTPRSSPSGRWTLSTRTTIRGPKRWSPACT